MDLKNLKNYLQGYPLEVEDFWYLESEKFLYIIAKDVSRGFMLRSFHEGTEDIEWVKDFKTYNSARHYFSKKYKVKGSFKKA